LPTFGRHLQHLGDKSRPVFDSLHIIPENLANKALYASLKLLPFLIRCLLLIHGNPLPILNEDDGHFKTKRRSRYIRAFASPGQFGRDFCNVLALVFWNNSMRFSERTFTRVIMKIMKCKSKWSANSPRKSRNFYSSFNNSGLD
jgi:hypothetical protein